MRVCVPEAKQTKMEAFGAERFIAGLSKGDGWLVSSSNAELLKGFGKHLKNIFIYLAVHVLVASTQGPAESALRYA